MTDVQSDSTIATDLDRIIEQGWERCRDQEHTLALGEMSQSWKATVQKLARQMYWIGRQAEHDRNDGEIAKIEKVLAENLQETGRGYAGSSLSERFIGTLRYLRSVATDTLAESQQVRDEIIVQLRALGIVIEMAGNASTHHEKNARLRGVSEIIEGAVKRLRDIQFARLERSSWWQIESIFRSDYPTREYLRKIRDLEAELKRLTPTQEGETVEGDAKDLPF